MMGRVSDVSWVNQFTYNAMNREADLEAVENELSSGFRVNLPSDDPVSTINFMDFDSRLNEIQTYSDTIEVMTEKLNLVDSQLESATTVIQRMRELAVQLANGVYAEEDRVNAAMEVDQLGRELLEIANSYYTDTTLFGGTANTEKPFSATFMTDPDTGMEIISEVKYLGNTQSQKVEVERGEYVTIAPPGNQIFWSENMMIAPTEPVTGYVAPTDSTIYVDDIPIEISQGDNLEVIVEKINDSGAAVSAWLTTQNSESYMVIESTDAHQITLMDTKGGTVLSDLGFIDSGSKPPENYASNAYVFTGSVFDTVINFRDALLDNDSEKIGSQILAQVDSSLDNMLTYRAHLGAVSERMDIMLERYLANEVYYEDLKNQAVGTDITESTMEMKLLEFSHQVALNIGARLLQTSLLDFLR